jgi:hypothetical protein
MPFVFSLKKKKKNRNVEFELEKMGRSDYSGATVYPVVWDRHTKSIAPVVGASDKNDEPKTVITILTKGQASVSVTLDAKELIKQGGRIDGALPAAADSIQLIDLKNPTWTPQQLRIVQLPTAAAAHDENLTAFVGRVVQLELSGKAEKLAGVIESVSPKSIVLCSAVDASLLLVERSQVIAASLPGLVGASIVASLGATADDFAPALTYTLPADQITARAHYSVDIDRNDAHVVVAGAWRVANRSSLAFENARVFVEQSLSPPTDALLSAGKNSNSFFSSVSKVKSNNNSNSNRVNNRRSSGSGSDSEDDGESRTRIVRFQVPGLLNLPVETGVSGTASVDVAFGSARVGCDVRNVVDFPKKTKSDAAHNDSAQAQFAVEFLLTADAFGKASPHGRATLWRAAHKSEPRRLITSITDHVHLPAAMLPHWAKLSTNFSLNVRRSSGPVKMLPTSGDIESRGPVLAEQTIKFAFHNSVLEKGAMLAIVDQDIEHFQRHAPSVPTSTRATCNSHRDGTTVIKETDVTIAPHAHTVGALVLAVPIMTRRSGDYELQYNIQFEVTPDDNGDGTSSTNDDGTPKPSSSSSSSARSNQSGSSSRVTTTTKVKKSGWFS